MELHVEELNTSTSHTFQIQEFRRPEYEVSSTMRSSGVHYCHPTEERYAISACQGKLFAGGFLTDAHVRWTVNAKSTTFTPANRSDYIFGRHRSFFFWFGGNDSETYIYPKQFIEVICADNRDETIFRCRQQN